MSFNNINQKKKVLLFLLFSAAFALKLDILKTISEVSPVYLTINGAYPWAILFLCNFFLISKYKELSPTYNSTNFIIRGIIICFISFFMPANAPEFEIFRLLLAWAGLAFIFFGEAASFPAILLCIFGFGISFPKLVDAYVGISYAQFSAWIAYSIGNVFLPITLGDTVISIITLSGERLLMIVNEACSGSASMSVFLVIFMLMSLDLPLPRHKWVLLLITGIIGTFLQNIVRLVLLMFVGYYFGHSAVESGESFAGYIIFPLWYTIFAFAYIKCYHNTYNYYNQR